MRASSEDYQVANQGDGASAATGSCQNSLDSTSQACLQSKHLTRSQSATPIHDGDPLGANLDKITSFSSYFLPTCVVVNEVQKSAINQKPVMNSTALLNQAGSRGQTTEFIPNSAASLSSTHPSISVVEDETKEPLLRKRNRFGTKRHTPASKDHPITKTKYKLACSNAELEQQAKLSLSETIDEAYRTLHHSSLTTNQKFIKLFNTTTKLKNAPTLALLLNQQLVQWLRFPSQPRTKSD